MNDVWEALGLVPMLVRWQLQFEENAPLALYDHLIVQWNMMGLKKRATLLEKRKQERCMLEVHALRSRLVPYEISLDMPSEPYNLDEIQEFRKEVELQEECARRIQELKKQIRLHGMPQRSFSKPYLLTEIEEAEAALTQFCSQKTAAKEAASLEESLPKEPLEEEAALQENSSTKECDVASVVEREAAVVSKGEQQDSQASKWIWVWVMIVLILLIWWYV